MWECTLRSNLICSNCEVACDQDEQAHTDMPLWNFFHLIASGVKKWRLFSKLDVLGIDCDRALVLNEKQIEEMLDFVNEVRAENKIEIAFACDNFMGKYEKKVHRDFFFCKAGISMATLFVDGLIGVCLLNRDESCIVTSIATATVSVREKAI